jgi:Holliday junction resolvase RusA-like endonuclease
MMRLAFTVFGVAVPKGNMRALMLKGMKFPIVTDSNRSAKSWQQLVAQGASQALQQLPPADRTLLTDGVRLTVAFYLPRPKKYSKRGVDVMHLTAPDIDKLLRSIGDALTKVVWQDDSQVVELVAVKRYAAVGEPPRVDICIEPSRHVMPMHLQDDQPVLFASF